MLEEDLRNRKAEFEDQKRKLEDQLNASIAEQH